MDQGVVTYGKLYLIPTRLGENPPLEVLPLSIKKILEITQHYIVENEKTARRFIKKVSPHKTQSKLKLFVLNKYTSLQDLPQFLGPCLSGNPVGVLSEAGCPAIADPGANIVQLAHQKGIAVVPLVGPSSILLALMASGFNGQQFSFNGYLPIDKEERKKAIKHFEQLSKTNNYTQIFIETPYRNNNLLKEFIRALKPLTKLCVATDLTLPSEHIQTLTVKEWKVKEIDLHKKPSIFLIQASL